MQASLTDRGSWLLWLAMSAVAVVFGVAWWQPWGDDAVVPAPAAAIAQPAIAPPASPPAPAPVQTGAPAPALKLIGTVAGGTGSFATMLRTTDSQVLQLRVGDQVDGLAVTAIEPDRVVLSAAGQPVVIEAERRIAVSAAPLSSPAASQVEAPSYPEGEAPWDLAPPFRH
jgi:hypothetical protein